ncbi:MAG: hypothetical protein RBT41_02535 [Clostridia bacterium]|jgi:hypothetical protein|nr:hypothetical protein [Clostridia bacterium]
MRKKLSPYGLILAVILLAFLPGTVGAADVLQPPVRYDFSTVQELPDQSAGAQATDSAEGFTLYTPVNVSGGWLYELAGGGDLEVRVGTLLFDNGALAERYIDIKGKNGGVRLCQNAFAAGEEYNKTQFWSFKKQVGAAIVKGADDGPAKCVTLFELPDGMRYIYGYIDGDGTNFWFLELNPKDCYTISPYNFIVRENSVQSRRVEFKGNQMYHGGNYIGFGVGGLPMLSLPYIAGEFGFTMDKDAGNGAHVVADGLGYSFIVKPGVNLAGIYYNGVRIKEYELMAKPVLRNGVLYLYSLDIRELLGMTSVWDNEARTWDVSYMDYTVKEYGFPAKVNDDVLEVAGLLIRQGNYIDTPSLIIKNTAKEVYSSFSGHSLAPDEDGLNRYEMNCRINLPDEMNPLQTSLTVGQRILMLGNLDMPRNIEARELQVKSPYQLTSPTQGYVKITEPLVSVSGRVEGVTMDYYKEIALFVKDPESEVTLQQESISLQEGKFQYDLKLTGGPGLYKVTLNDIMAAPRGLAYPEITYFYVDYRKI